MPSQAMPPARAAELAPTLRPSRVIHPAPTRSTFLQDSSPPEICNQRNSRTRAHTCPRQQHHRQQQSDASRTLYLLPEPDSFSGPVHRLVRLATEEGLSFLLSRCFLAAFSVVFMSRWCKRSAVPHCRGAFLAATQGSVCGGRQGGPPRRHIVHGVKAATLLDYKGEDWLQLRRLAFSSQNESRTSTRAIRYVATRWHDGLRYAREHRADGGLS